MNRFAFAVCTTSCLLLPAAGCGRAGDGRTSAPKGGPASPAVSPNEARPVAAAVSPVAQGPILLRDVTARTKIAFRHTNGGSGRLYLVESVASGVATFDYDGDGLIDIYFLNGSPLRGAESAEKSGRPVSRNALYRNLGDFQFADVTEQAGVGDPGYGLGVCAGDYDNDGHPDLFVNNFGPNVLYRNRGDGTFARIAAAPIAGPADAVGAGANFLDYDADGDLDLFIAHYVGFTYANHVTNIVWGKPWYASPLDFPRQANRLLRNEGNGAFTDVSEASGIAAHAGAGMGTICLDYDNDRDTDIFVCNDQYWDFLFRNDGGGEFAEVGLLAGVASNFAGEMVGSMGADGADYDRDGWLDLFVTDFEQQKPILLHNLGGGQFEDATLKSGAAAGAVAQVKWGVGFVDFDHDALCDLFIGCGHLGEDFNPHASRIASYRAPPVILRNLGQGRFADVSAASGDGARAAMVARGVACDDLDNDGRVDVVVLNSRRAPTVLRNESDTGAGAGNGWLQIRLLGITGNRDGIGARVRVTAGGVVQTAEAHSGRGYQSHFGDRMTFGLGPRDRVERLEVRWLGGGVDAWEDIEANREFVAIEGAAAVKFP